MSSRVLVVMGLGHGDEGKGAVVDHAARAAGPVTVVRFNGGPQASHHVVLPGGVWHGFSQFGAATFVPGCTTHLSRQTYVEPANLLREAAVLEDKGVRAPLETLTLDPGCPLVTPAHKYVGQVREVARGVRAHGSVGMGVGEAVLDGRTRRGDVLRAGDILDHARLATRLREHVQAHAAAAQALADAHPSEEMERVRRHFRHRLDMPGLLEEYRSLAAALASRFRRDDHMLPDLVRAGRPLVLEGAQGTLLDPVAGFPPHVTKTPCTVAAARALLADLPAETHVMGVTRAHAHRHGPGPLVTEDHDLGRRLAEPHNVTNRWQGPFRHGWLDLVMSRYAVAVNPGVEALAVTGLDRLTGLGSLRACASYRLRGPVPSAVAHRFHAAPLADGDVHVRGLRPPLADARETTPHLAEVLGRCSPLGLIHLAGWEGVVPGPVAGGSLPVAMAAYLELMSSEQGLGLPVAVASLGPTWGDKVVMAGATSTFPWR
jgi:adenylosuccinate synthase